MSQVQSSMLVLQTFRSPKWPQGPLALVALVLLSLLLCVPEISLAQINTGGITGTVKDTTGAVVSGAKITLTNDATGIVTSTESTSTGTYSLGGVMPGTYTLRGSATGFQEFVDKGLEVHVQQTLTVDLPLEAGSVRQEVVVTAAAPLLQADRRSRLKP
jgi:hypothetical protein